MKRPARIPWPKDEEGNVLDTPAKRAAHLVGLNDRLAVEFRISEVDVERTPGHIENLKWQKTLAENARKYERQYDHDKRNEGALKTNPKRKDAAAEQREDVRHYYRHGDSWKKVAERMRADGAEVPTERTLQRRIWEIRNGQ